MSNVDFVAFRRLPLGLFMGHNLLTYLFEIWQSCTTISQREVV